MTSRVEICGINTATLPKLSHNDAIELLKKAQAGDEQSRDEFIMSNMRLVLSIIHRFYNKKESIDDIFQVGCIGLIKSMENFNTQLNLRFSTYAVPMIIGEIKRFLRDSSSIRVSRSVRDTAYRALQARQLLEVDNCNVSLEDIAMAIDLPLMEVVYALDAISDPVSLFDPVYHDDSETMLLMDQIGDPKCNDDNWLNNVTLSEAMKKLSAREKQIILLRFYEGKTQTEVSSEVGISQAQVSRLEKNAITILQKYVD